MVLGHNNSHNLKSLQEIPIAGESKFMYSSSIATYHSTAINAKVAGNTRVLVVDDDHDATELLKIVLEPNAFEVITAHSGQEGIELARQLNPDVMVVDLLMPGIDGMRVCREVRCFSNVPILILSALGKRGVAEQALEQGADDFLIKPMNNSVLIASLNKLARRARGGQKLPGKNGNSSVE
jgi:DNA-binding response OmpR family regulator